MSCLSAGLDAEPSTIPCSSKCSRSSSNSSGISSRVQTKRWQVNWLQRSHHQADHIHQTGTISRWPGPVRKIGNIYLENLYSLYFISPWYALPINRVRQTTKFWTKQQGNIENPLVHQIFECDDWDSNFTDEYHCNQTPLNISNGLASKLLFKIMLQFMVSFIDFQAQFAVCTYMNLCRGFKPKNQPVKYITLFC